MAIDYISLVDESFLTKWQDFIIEWQKRKFDDYFENLSEDEEEIIPTVYKLKYNDVVKALDAKSDDEKLFCKAQVASWVAVNMIEYKNNKVPFQIIAVGVPKEMAQEAYRDLLNQSESSRGSGCFIATATFEDYNAPEVIFFRKLRDNYLLPSNLGRIIIKCYYMISPSIAMLISSNKYLRDKSKTILINIIKYLK
jgi:hypothetical protein